MTRSSRGRPFADESLLKKIKEIDKPGQKTVIKTWPRRSTIFPAIVGLMVAVRDGRKRAPAYITGDMVGHKLGKFVAIHTYRGYDTDERETGLSKQ